MTRHFRNFGEPGHQTLSVKAACLGVSIHAMELNREDSIYAAVYAIDRRRTDV